MLLLNEETQTRKKLEIKLKEIQSNETIRNHGKVTELNAIEKMALEGIKKNFF